MRCNVLNPDRYATAAAKFSKAGLHTDAFHATTLSIKARAEWVLVNGQWHPRRGVMRDA
jgi:hypothetical protein